MNRLLQQPDVLDDHVLVHRLAHIVEGEESHRNT